MLVVYTFIWEEDFPISGDYKFRGMADNIGRIFIDNELVLEERRFREIHAELYPNILKKVFMKLK